MKPLRFLAPPRRWLQIRLRTAFILATAICMCFAWPHLTRQYAFRRLCRYADRDTSDVWTFKDGSVWNIAPRSTETEHIERLVGRLLPHRNELESAIYGRFDGNLRMIREVENSRARLLIAFVRPTFVIPGSGDVRVVLFDSFGRVVADKKISTGNRYFVQRVTFERSDTGFPCLVVDSDYWWVGLKQRQYIAVRDETVALVRSEEIKGEGLGDVTWYKSRHLFGPEYRFVDHAEWSNALMSDDEITVLEALLYLPPQDVVTKRDASNLARLEQLACSKNPWIKEGASAALAEFAQRF